MDRMINEERINRIFEETAYVRTGCTEEEHRCARYLQELCREIGLEASLEPFQVEMSEVQEARLFLDGEEVPCKGYLCSGSGDVEAPLFYLANRDSWSLEQCRGKIVLVDGYLGYWDYQDLVGHGAVGFITYDGSVNYADEDVDQRRLSPKKHLGNQIPGVNINAKTATAMIKAAPEKVRILLRQEEYNGTSHNVVAEIPGNRDEIIVFTAHYDTTFLSTGAYDNMSGCVGILGIAEYFMKHKPNYTLRFVWCGSEEIGLLGSEAYAEARLEEMNRHVLCINLDMVGTIMGDFRAICTTEKKLVHYIEYLAMEYGFGMKARQAVYSSDSTPIADKGVPAVTFARQTTSAAGTIHNRYDSLKLMSGRQMVRDIDFMTCFAVRMANAACCPVSREIPANMKDELDYYQNRKRKPEEA